MQRRLPLRFLASFRPNCKSENPLSLGERESTKSKIKAEAAVNLKFRAMVRVCLFLFFVLVVKKLGNVAYERWDACEDDYLISFVLVFNRIFSPASNL